jgi:tol-pal system protein YbgF
MSRLFAITIIVLTFAAATLSSVGSASAQESGRESDSPFSVFHRLFGDKERTAPPEENRLVAQASPADLVVRIDRLEAQIRQLTGTIEQLQFRNQQLEAQLRQVTGSQPPSVQLRQPAAGGSPPPPAPLAANGRRSDAFDPTQNPNAPGSPQTLGALPNGTLPGGAPPAANLAPGSDSAEAPIGAPGGRQVGAPLDLTTLGSNQLGGNPMNDPNLPQSSTLPPPPARNLSSTGAVASTLPPSSSPKDQYDLGYGYVLRKDYALAEDAFQTFLTKFPADRLVPEAQFWLGESRFQRQRYDAAAEAFLAVSTKYTSNARAPEAMLRLGQSLAALGQKQMACATLAEVGRKFPRATANVRQGVEREQKRVSC